MTQQHTTSFRLIAWMSALLLLGANAVASHALCQDEARGRGAPCTIAPASHEHFPLLATRTLVTKAAPIPSSWRDLEVPFSSAILLRPALWPACGGAFHRTGRTTPPPPRVSLVGVVELRM